MGTQISTGNHARPISKSEKKFLGQFNFRNGILPNGPWFGVSCLTTRRGGPRPFGESEQPSWSRLPRSVCEKKMTPTGLGPNWLMESFASSKPSVSNHQKRSKLWRYSWASFSSTTLKWPPTTLVKRAGTYFEYGGLAAHMRSSYLYIYVLHSLDKLAHSWEMTSSVLHSLGIMVTLPSGRCSLWRPCQAMTASPTVRMTFLAGT